MENCPRCQAPLERLTLGNATTLSCERCGYADVPVDHQSLTREDDESWRDAFDRFYKSVRSEQ